MNDFMTILHDHGFEAGGAPELTDGCNPAPHIVRIRSAGEAMTEVARHLARRGIDWRRPEAVESIGVLGFRIWFSPGLTVEARAISHTVDVRLDGEVRFVAT
jgi:hypothetical protein